MLTRSIIVISLFLFIAGVVSLSLLGRGSSHSLSHAGTPTTQQGPAGNRENCQGNQGNMEGTQEFKILTRNFSHSAFLDPDETQWRGDFSFIQAADTQLGLLERYVEKKPNPGWSREIAWTREMVRDVNSIRPRPRFIVICGDLVDAYPVEELTSTRKQQVWDLKNELRHLEIPLVCVCGNHDVGDTPDAQTIAQYRSEFGDDYYSFWSGGVYFLVLNSQFWQDDSQAQELSAKHQEWLERQLEVIKRSKPKYAMVFQHIPPFVNSPDEPKQYFNLEVDLRKSILDRFIDAGISHVFCGHYHRNAGGKYGELEVIVTSAVGAQLGKDTNGFRLVKVTDSRVQHDYFALGEINRDDNNDNDNDDNDNDGYDDARNNNECDN